MLGFSPISDINKKSGGEFSKISLIFPSLKSSEKFMLLLDNVACHQPRELLLLGWYRPTGVFGKGVGNSKNASEMRQNGSCFIGKRGTFQNASEMRQNCVKNARNTFGGEHLLDDTDQARIAQRILFCRTVGRRSLREYTRNSKSCSENGFSLRAFFFLFVKIGVVPRFLHMEDLGIEQNSWRSKGNNFNLRVRSSIRATSFVRKLFLRSVRCKIAPSQLATTIFAIARKAFQLEFGAYRGLAWVLKLPSNLQNCRKKENIMEKGTFIFCAKLWYAPNPGSKEI